MRMISTVAFPKQRNGSFPSTTERGWILSHGVSVCGLSCFIATGPTAVTGAGAWTCHQHASVREETETETLTCCNPAKFSLLSQQRPVLKMKWSSGFQPPKKRGSSAIFVMREFWVFKLRLFFSCFVIMRCCWYLHGLEVFKERRFFRNINHGALNG